MEPLVATQGVSMRASPIFVKFVWLVNPRRDAAMSRRSELRNLLAKWRRRKEPGDRNFVEDGIVDEAGWDSARVKLLFITKEPNDLRRGVRWSLTKFCARGGVQRGEKNYSPSWDLMARWVYGILSKDWPSWKEIEKLKHKFKDPKGRKPWLRQIAVINLKKSGGGGSTPQGSLGERAQKHAQLLRRQISIIGPEVVICCGTGPEVFGKVYAKDEFSPERWDATSNGVQFTRHSEGGWFLFDYCHPQARWPHHFMYTMLMLAVREVLGR